MNYEQDKIKRTRTMGLIFLLMAFCFGSYSIFSPNVSALPFDETTHFLIKALYLTPDQRETYLMVSFVIAFAGIFCIGSVRSSKN